MPSASKGLHVYSKFAPILTFPSTLLPAPFLVFSSLALKPSVQPTKRCLGKVWDTRDGRHEAGAKDLRSATAVVCPGFALWFWRLVFRAVCGLDFGTRRLHAATGSARGNVGRVTGLAIEWQGGIVTGLAIEWQGGMVTGLTIEAGRD